MKPGSLSRERWSLVEPLLDAALELEPDERCAFLDEACRRDAALRSEVEALLLACEHGEDILSLPAAIAYGPLLEEPTFQMPAKLGGRYEIVREIGRGGMATVYLADDPKHGRQVAVKVLHGEIARIIGRERFEREIEIAANLSHPHILPLFDSGEAMSGESSFLFFVSPFVTGESLRGRLKREPKLLPAEAVQLAREIGLALDYAHRQGVIHLDIKPENILLQDGHAVITDFGIARAVSGAGEKDKKVAGRVPLMGTPSYMSPEQALGRSDVDARSDVYSLGCVLYEMLVGEGPFPRATPAEAIARARVLAAPDPTALNEKVSPALAAVVLRAMAPARNDRFSAAAELAHALRGTVRVMTQRPVPRSRKKFKWGIAAAALVSLLAFFFMRPGSALDSNLLAVAPFDIPSPALALWEEGMVDVMSRNLDGAGALRTVPASVVVRHWQGRADAQSARALGERTGARLVLFGGLLTAGDSVRVTAVLLDASTGSTVAEFERRDEVGRIDRLSDSLTVAVLRELARTRHIDMARATSWPTTSLPALKAYLQGEQFYRAALWDSAQVHFMTALGYDSAFALAYHRVAAVMRWRDVKEQPDSTAYVYMRRTSRFPRGLGPRERLLATVDSLTAETYFASLSGLVDTIGNESTLGRRLVGTLGDALLRYPNDPELWFLLAQARSEFDPNLEGGELDDREILALFDRAIALDSSFAPAYVKPIALAAYLDGTPSARQYIKAYLAIEPTGPYSQVIRLDDILLDPARARSLDVDRLVDTLSPDGLNEAMRLLRHSPDSSELAIRMARALMSHSGQLSSASPNPTTAAMLAVYGLQFRGHLREAHRMSSVQAHWLRPTVLQDMSRFGMVPADTGRAELNRILALSPRITLPSLYSWWASEGDTLAIQTYMKVYGRTDRPRSPAGYEERRAVVAAGRAFLALARHDTTSALRLFLTTPDTLQECRFDKRFAIVQLLRAKGRYQEAAAQLERRWPGTTGCSDSFVDVLWTMERARVFEHVGRQKEAAENYAFVANVWRNADTELQSYVRESHAALARLSAPRVSVTAPKAAPKRG